MAVLSGHCNAIRPWRRLKLRRACHPGLRHRAAAKPSAVVPAYCAIAHYGRDDGDSYADLASAPSIIATAFVTPYTATNEPKRGPFS